MDLFTPIVDQTAQHPNFARMMNYRNSANEEVLQEWAEGFVDRDRKFVKEFQTTFDSSFWELYLHAVLRQVGCNIDWSHHAPDFVITDPQDFCIEATIASHAFGCIPATKSYQSPVPPDLNELNRQAIIRLGNSFRSKFDAFQKNYSKLLHCKDKPFVLAIAPFDRPYFWLQCNRAIEAFLFNYYVDEETFDRYAPDAQLKAYELLKVAKDSGAEIPLGAFSSPQFSAISAVIFSTTASWGKVRALADEPDALSIFESYYYNPEGVMPFRSVNPKSKYTESLLDGLRVYYNPFAKYPLTPALFRSPEVYQMFYNEQSNELVRECGSQNLLMRSLVTIKAT